MYLLISQNIKPNVFSLQVSARNWKLFGKEHSHTVVLHQENGSCLKQKKALSPLASFSVIV